MEDTPQPNKKNWLDDTNFDVILLGTGITESLLAGALARVGKKVLHLDKNEFYGGNCSAYTLQGFENLLKGKLDGNKIKQEDKSSTIIFVNSDPIFLYNCESSSQVLKTSPSDIAQESKLDGAQDPSQSPTSVSSQQFLFDDLVKESRLYNIDLTPKLFFSRGPEVNLLISSGVSKYLEFKAMESIYIFMEGGMQLVPCSKGDIFKSKFITHIEKRSLSKFISFVNSDETTTEDTKSERDETLDTILANGSFIELLRHQNLSPKLQAFALYAIGLISNDQASVATITAQEGMQRLRKFVNSLGVYSPNPFLVPLYGVSELPQAFCRLCAVFGGLYVLRRSVIEIHIENNSFTQVLDTEGQILTGQHLVVSAEYVPQFCDESNQKGMGVSRCVCITDSSLINGESLILNVVPPGACGNKYAVKVLQLDSTVSVCAKGKYLLHFITDSDATTARDDLQQIVKQLTCMDPDETSTKPKVLYWAFFNEPVMVPKPSTQIPSNLFICSSIDSELDCAKHVAEARQIFAKICPNEVFLPKAPEPEEIIYVRCE